MKTSRKWLLLFSLFISISIIGATITVKMEMSTTANSSLLNNKKWRIGYVETDPYYNYAGTLHGIIEGLHSIGLVGDITDMPYIFGQSDSTEMWAWLASKQISEQIEFVSDAHYSFFEPETDGLLRKRLEKEHDLDLMIVMGTSSGQRLAQYEHDVPMLVFSSSDAVGSGIIQSIDDSGVDHIWAHVDPGRYQRQLEVFHDIFNFKKLGLIFEDSPNGRIYSAYHDVQQLSQARGFEVFEYHVNEPSGEMNDYDRYHQEVTEGIKVLAEKVDAVYLTANQIQKDKLAKMLQPFYEKNIPVFSQIGSNEVEHGALLSLYRANYLGIGRFGAETIKDVLNGTKPRDLNQVYGDTPSIVLNLEVANKIGYHPPFEVLLATDKIYQTIKGDY